MDFFTTSSCNTRRACRICRDREGGRRWRESIIRLFGLLPESPDFDCPHGVSWGAGQVANLLIPREAHGICLRCMERTCPNVRSCCSGKVFLNIQYPCRHLKWQIEDKEGA